MQDYIGFPDIIQHVKDTGENADVYPIREKAWMGMGQFESMEEMRKRVDNESCLWVTGGRYEKDAINGWRMLHCNRENTKPLASQIKSLNLICLGVFPFRLQMTTYLSYTPKAMNGCTR